MGTREILIKPRQIDITATTLVAKLPTIAIDALGTDSAKAMANEIFTYSDGSAYIARSSPEKIFNGTTDVDANLVPVKTPTSLLPRFTNNTTALDTGADIFLHTDDVRATPDKSIKHKAISLLGLKSWIVAAVSGDVANVGKVLVKSGDTLGFLKDKLVPASDRDATTNIVIEFQEIGASAPYKLKAVATPVYNSDQMAIKTTGNYEMYIKAINGGTI